DREDDRRSSGRISTSTRQETDRRSTSSLQEAGRRGGEAVASRYGSDFHREIGRQGGSARRGSRNLD
ncbi:MAG: hypothetical protein LW832_02450, partial [Parachlamydia sp.]|nr:hypothetical protein [Parachlamydia sp.]